MSNLTELIAAHTANTDRKNSDIDMIFFGVNIINYEEIDKEVLTKTISDHKGSFCECDLFDGEEHSFIEIGAWLGDQGYALHLMALLSHVGLVQLLTPISMLGSVINDTMAVNMAGQGMITIIKSK